MQTIHAKLAGAAIILLAIGFTLLSQFFVRPVNCQSLCGEPEGSTCPAGACRAFEQRAGLPLPFRIDDPGGGSPTGGWGILGEEDLPNPFLFLVDVGFYSLLLWLSRYAVQVMRKKVAVERLAIALPLAVLLALLVAGFFFYRPFLNR